MQVPSALANLWVDAIMQKGQFAADAFSLAVVFGIAGQSVSEYRIIGGRKVGFFFGHVMRTRLMFFSA
jgi:hypothetical protein